MVAPHLQAGWLSADLGPSPPGGLEVTLPGTQCSSAEPSTSYSLRNERKPPLDSILSATGALIGLFCTNIYMFLQENQQLDRLTLSTVIHT